jgi:hypothetical protein
MTPLPRLIVPSLPGSETPAFGVPVTVTGGHAEAQDPVQAEVVPWSLANQYIVYPLESVSTVPLVVSTVLMTVPLVVVVLGVVLLAVALGTVAAVGLVELPHPATAIASSARAAPPYIRFDVCLMPLIRIREPSGSR